MTAGPWRVLVLDRDPADPKWIIATVAAPEDVKPASLDALAEDVEVWAWVGDRTGTTPDLTPVRDARAWRIDDQPEWVRS